VLSDIAGLAIAGYSTLRPHSCFEELSLKPQAGRMLQNNMGHSLH
jgi:hypothetical protein